MNREETILYQFPISHYCEKARWALAFKEIPYRIVNLAPGLHFRRTRNMGCAG
ncbi:MAG TPA: glutathione S-transferase N-terminal domain-containing protein, partial [bacterium]|nr:glutathione S-transferase N-terminal domain-containing protein [bacterium]